jgi:hypothetical protein
VPARQKAHRKHPQAHARRSVAGEKVRTHTGDVAPEDGLLGNSQSDGIAANHSLAKAMGFEQAAQPGLREDSMRSEGMNETLRYRSHRSEASNCIRVQPGWGFSPGMVSSLQQEVLSVVHEFINGLMNVGQRCVGLCLLETRQNLWLPSFGQFL